MLHPRVEPELYYLYPNCSRAHPTEHLTSPVEAHDQDTTRALRIPETGDQTKSIWRWGKNAQRACKICFIVL